MSTNQVIPTNTTPAGAAGKTRSKEFFDALLELEHVHSSLDTAYIEHVSAPENEGIRDLAWSATYFGLQALERLHERFYLLCKASEADELNATLVEGLRTIAELSARGSLTDSEAAKALRCFFSLETGTLSPKKPVAKVAKSKAKR